MTQITPELKSKLAYRYYNYDNDTPTIFFPQWVGTDEHIYAPGRRAEASIPTSYTKQNGARRADLDAVARATLGAQYGYERYNWSWNDADHTSENLGKLYGVYKSNSWLIFRGSWQFSERRYGTYTNSIQSSLNGGWNPQLPQSRVLPTATRTRASSRLMSSSFRRFTVSPFAGLLLRDYKTDARCGRDRHPERRFLERRRRNLFGRRIAAPNSCSPTHMKITKNTLSAVAAPTGLATNTWDSNVNDR